MQGLRHRAGIPICFTRSLRYCVVSSLTTTHPLISSPAYTHSHFGEISTLKSSFHTTCPSQICTRHATCMQHVFQLTSRHFHTSPSPLADNQKEERRIYVWWRKFATLIKNFTAGVKSLYSDVKLMSDYKMKYGNLVIKKSAPTPTGNGKTDLLYSRKEMQFMYRTRKDVRKMLPTVILFFIPFLGYFAPIIAFAYPEQLLSQHFWTPSQRESLMAARRESQKKSFSGLAEAVKSNPGKDLSFIPMMTDQFLQHGGSPLASSTESFSELSSVSTDHKGHLYGGWSIKSLLPFEQLLRGRLQTHLEFVFVSDWLIRLEGGAGKLTHTELVDACMERGLDVDLKAPGLDNDDATRKDDSCAEMRERLDSWVAVSTQHKECPSLLLAYLPIAQYSISQ